MGCYSSKNSGRSSPSPGTNIDIVHTDSRSTADIQLQDRINLPLRRHVWMTKTPLSSSELGRRREEYWDTRVSERQEVWSAIRMAVDVVDVDLGTAQRILEAAGVSVPSGDLIHGVFDEFGNRYDLPEYCCSRPNNLIYTQNIQAIARKEPDAEEDEEEGEESEEETEVRRQEKGKMPVHDIKRELAVRARISDGLTKDVTVRFSKDERVRTIARRVAEGAGIPTGDFKIRIVYLGRMLKENEPLLTQGWVEGHIINALVFNKY